MRDGYIDFHCHILPGMDFDGTKDVQETVAMCRLLKKQGVAAVCATPHFYPWQEDADAFFARRDAAMRALADAGGDLPVFVGAEVQIFRDLADFPLDRMCIGNSRVVLLELPEQPFDRWMVTVMENAVYRYSLIPMIAHIERYGLTEEQLAEFAGIPGVVFQITAGELGRKRMLHTLYTVSSMRVPVVLGSDAHNMTSRAPSFDRVHALLAKKARLFDRSTAKAQAILENAMEGQKSLAAQLMPEKIFEPRPAQE